MSLKLHRRGPIWHLRGTVRGVNIRETTGTSDRQAAEQIRIRREAEILDQSIHGRRATATFAQAALNYLDAGGDPRFLGTVDENTGKWTGLIGHFGDRRLTDIHQSDLDEAARILHPGCSPSTLNRQVYTPFIAVWNCAAEGNNPMCHPVRWRRPKQPKGRTRWITVADMWRLADVADTHIRPLIIFLHYTGARLSEALCLDWDDVDLSTRWAVFRKTKSGGARGVPLHVAVIAALANLPDEDYREGFVFLNTRGQPYSSHRGPVFSWDKALKRAGIDDYTRHDARHSLSTWLNMADVTPRTREAILGHVSGNMDHRYCHVPDREMIDAIDRLPTRTKSAQAPYLALKKRSNGKA